jgi:hypothetical protein
LFDDGRTHAQQRSSGGGGSYATKKAKKPAEALEEYEATETEESEMEGTDAEVGPLVRFTTTTPHLDL